MTRATTLNWSLHCDVMMEWEVASEEVKTWLHAFQLPSDSWHCSSGSKLRHILRAAFTVHDAFSLHLRLLQAIRLLASATDRVGTYRTRQRAGMADKIMGATVSKLRYVQ